MPIPRRYRAVVLPLGFKFDVDAVLVAWHGPSQTAGA